MAVRVQGGPGPGSRFTIPVAVTSTVGDVQAAIFEKLAISAESQSWKCGFPPKIVVTEGQETSLLSAIGVKPGDAIIVTESSRATPTSSSAPAPAASLPTYSTSFASSAAAPVAIARPSPPAGEMQRHVVPANNSCLFASLAFLLEPGQPDSAAQMRETVAGIILSQPDTYSAAVLGKEPETYVAWILDTEHWGGYIELNVLAKYFGVHIVAFDIQTLIGHAFGDAEGFTQMCFVIYDGIHYDPIAQFSVADGSVTARTFQSTDKAAYEKAKAIAAAANKARLFVDVAGFSIRCLACQQLLKGQREAQEHAKATGHTNFGQV